MEARVSAYPKPDTKQAAINTRCMSLYRGDIWARLKWRNSGVVGAKRS